MKIDNDAEATTTRIRQGTTIIKLRLVDLILQISPLFVKKTLNFQPQVKKKTFTMRLDLGETPRKPTNRPLVLRRRFVRNVVSSVLQHPER
jgi:hypothetical protein